MVVGMVAGFLFSSCQKRSDSGVILESQKLFTIQIGVMEDEIDLFHRGQALPNKKNRIFMYQGLVFVGNSIGNKIMEFSSYGDLLSLLYNEETNPRPVLLSPIQQGQKVANKTFVAFPFQEIGEIAVTSDHLLLVEDHVPPERRLLDQDTGAVLQHIIHRFGADGEYLDYIGQEGVGGTPFPFIVSLNLTSRDEMVVVTRTLNDYWVYWYGTDGDILFTVHIDEAHLPASNENGYVPSLSKIYPDLEELRLYLSVNYESAEEIGVDSRVITLDVSSGVYNSRFRLPENLEPVPGSEGMEYLQSVYHFIGTAQGGYLFFLGRNNTMEHSLIILDSQGKLVADRILRHDNSEVFLSEFSVSKEGIITALLGDPRGADIYWWRSDELIK